jgi:deazaflavin-dependent oxidoreductase (nitroreductase family)
MTAIRLPKPPRGWSALLWRLPIWFYRMGLGWMMGKRFLLLTHTGRVSGQARQAVIEVVRHDPQSNTYYAVSGFGEKAQWFQNTMETPQVRIQVGSRKSSALAEWLPFEEAKSILQEYARQHPTALREISRLLKLPYDGSLESLSALARALPVVAFHIEAQSRA